MILGTGNKGFKSKQKLLITDVEKVLVTSKKPAK